MYRVTLVNAPFASVPAPSLALMQLKAVVEQQCGDAVNIRLLYLNHDFAKYIGIDVYNIIANTVDANTCGLGDWFFSHLAFPGKPNNADDYFTRFFRSAGPIAASRGHIIEKRCRVDQIVSDVIQRYALDDDDLVGFTSMFCQSTAVFAIARELKRRNPRIVTVMGGANCESPMGETIVREISAIDFVCSGPALKSFPTLLGRLVHNSEDRRCHSINGVLSRQSAQPVNRNILFRTESVGQVGDELSIDHEIRIDYGSFLDTLDTTFGVGTIKPVLHFETSRGCWWGAKAHCTFCGLNGQTMAYRAMSPTRAIANFETLYSYAHRCSRLQAVDNIMPKEYVTDVFPMLRAPDNIKVFYEVKADLTHEDLAVLARAHVTEIQPGIESLATSTLRLMKKGTSAFQNVTFLRHCRELGITPHWNLLIGFPGEDEQVYEKYLRDIPVLAHLPPPFGVFPVRFDRYSPYFVRARDYGLDLHASDWYSYVYPFSEEVIAELAYYFTDQTYDARYFDAMTRFVKPLRDRTNDWIAKWNTPATLPPRLQIERHDSGAMIVDSRCGSIRRYSIDVPALAMLRHFCRPNRVADIVEAAGEDGVESLGWLTDRSLLFEEDGRAISLVFGIE